MAFSNLIQNIRDRFCFEKQDINGYRICNANIYKRFIAFFLDLFLVLLTATILLSFTIKTTNNINIDEKTETNEIEQKNNQYLIKKISNTLFFILFLYFFTTNIYLKSTLGQKLFKLRIVSINKKDITKYDLFNKALFTTFIIMVANVFIVLLFFILPLLLTNYKVTLLDMITNTNIIELKNLK